MKSFLIGIGFIAVIACSMWAGRSWNNLRVNARASELQRRNSKLNEDVENLFVSLQKYKEKVGSYPPGGNAEVAKALQGNNSKNVIVIVGRKTEFNEKGEFIDPWNTPLRIYFSDNNVLIRSAGPNRRFDDSTVTDGDDFIRSN